MYVDIIKMNLFDITGFFSFQHFEVTWLGQEAPVDMTLTVRLIQRTVPENMELTVLLMQTFWQIQAWICSCGYYPWPLSWGCPLSGVVERATGLMDVADGVAGLVKLQEEPFWLQRWRKLTQSAKCCDKVGPCFSSVAIYIVFRPQIGFLLEFNF